MSAVRCPGCGRVGCTWPRLECGGEPAMTGQPSVVEQVAEELYRLDHTTLMGGLSAAAGWAQRRYRQRAEALADAGLLASGPTLAAAWDRGVGAFGEAWEQDQIEPWSHLPENPYRTTEMKGDDRG